MRTPVSVTTEGMLPTSSPLCDQRTLGTALGTEKCMDGKTESFEGENVRNVSIVLTLLFNGVSLKTFLHNHVYLDARPLTPTTNNTYNTIHLHSAHVI